MPLLIWNDFFKVKIGEIDNQHRRLFEITNRLYDAIKRGEGNEQVGECLADLLNYTVYHFKTEERLFEAHQYPDRGAHKEKHDGFVSKITDLKDRFERGSPTVTDEVMTLLQDWLVNHIMKIDQKYAPFLNGKGVV